jgi:hypothetical protein
METQEQIPSTMARLAMDTDNAIPGHVSRKNLRAKERK